MITAKDIKNKNERDRNKFEDAMNSLPDGYQFLKHEVMADNQFHRGGHKPHLATLKSEKENTRPKTGAAKSVRAQSGKSR